MHDQYNFRQVFAAACIGMLLFGVVIITLGSILPSLIEKFHLDELGAGMLTSILPGGILAGSLVFGPIVDRYSYKYLLVTCGVIIMLGLQGIALTEDLLVLQLSLAAIGFGGGVINGGTNALVSDISDDGSRKRSANLSLLGVFFGIGALGMPSLLAILSKSFGTYEIIHTVGLSLILPIVYFGIIKFPKPKHASSIPLQSSLKLVKDPSLILLGLILFFQGGIEGIVNNWSTLYFETEINMIKDQALYALSLFVLSLTVARIFLSILLNRVRSYQVLILSMTLSTLGILCFISGLPNKELVGLIMLGAGLAAGFPIILGYTGALYPDLSGTAFSIVLAISLTGNILLNMLMGVISNRFGIGTYPFILLVIAICLAGALTITLKKISTKTTI